MLSAVWEPLLEQVANKLAGGDGDSRRLFHGRGRSYAGLEQVSVDSFFPAILVTFFEPHRGETALCEGLWRLAQPSGYRGVAVQRRYLAGVSVDWVCGVVVATPMARRGGLKFPLTFERQNVGFFLDIEPGRIWLEEQIRFCTGQKPVKMLNLFAFTCVFSAVARSAGNIDIVNVDVNRGVLKRGRENHVINGLPLEGIQFLPLDALRQFKRFDRRGPFQLGVVDPPTRQKGRFDVIHNYAKLLQQLPACLAEEADLLMVINSPRYSEARFRELILEADMGYAVAARLPQNPDFPDRDADAALKMLHVKYRRRH
ncbi:class I SAM-dependent methyltransferase [Microbulbifer sp. 2205BS26-8]|uniref:class I SAM-dependent methyltransferase n=1 Tax=Microbulbifer sp. 2205BS26-8 TaxID=3064386 RepID=UPI00273D6712|nr:class I SAM-dependent methyltransferase [Microbulbifer sp. 2205BS26-8]MDP5210039.1 class I SAM-dependent methyltransferase [Microbulbifer sp. 2205BS26-8]